MQWLFVKSGLRRDRILQFDSVDDTTEGGIRSFAPVVIADKREIPLQVLERTELRQTLQLAIASLPQTYRETLLLRDVEELSIRETAAVLGVSEGLVKTRLFRARLMMQKILLPQKRTARRTQIIARSGVLEPANNAKEHVLVEKI
jgi:RNA polymerase sigma-70 factor (ECF subfamily)